LPPVRLVALLSPVGKCARRALPLRSARPAELPQLARRALVVVDEVIQVGGVNLAGVEPDESVAHALQQSSQLLVVVGSDDLSRRTPSGALPSAINAAQAASHAGTVAPRARGITARDPSGARTAATVATQPQRLTAATRNLRKRRRRHARSPLLILSEGELDAEADRCYSRIAMLEARLLDRTRSSPNGRRPSLIRGRSAR
jgi:hypothetical protein